MDSDACGFVTEMKLIKCRPLAVSDQLVSFAVMMLLAFVVVATAPVRALKPRVMSLLSYTILSTVPKSK